MWLMRAGLRRRLCLRFRGKRLQLFLSGFYGARRHYCSIATSYVSRSTQLQYQARVLVNGVAESTVQDILASSVSCAVTSVSRGCSHGSEVYDSNFFCGDFRHGVMSRTFQAGNLYSYLRHGDLPSTFSALPTRSLFYLLVARSLECQLRQLQRRLSSTASSRVHQYAHCSSSRQWIDFQPLIRSWSSAACL
uniref:Uncharacterized protein n=1 Tax=Hyaloperonospora arabidopsidis (strain Emoy2) TaxID=559515 RepID=M4BCQ7_HYAAE